PSGDQRGAVSRLGPWVKRRGALPSVPAIHTLERYSSRSSESVVTTKATRRSSGEIWGSVIQRIRVMSCGSKGWRAVGGVSGSGAMLPMLPDRPARVKRAGARAMLRRVKVKWLLVVAGPTLFLLAGSVLAILFLPFPVPRTATPVQRLYLTRC